MLAVHNLSCKRQPHRNGDGGPVQACPTLPSRHSRGESLQARGTALDSGSACVQQPHSIVQQLCNCSSRLQSAGERRWNHKHVPVRSPCNRCCRTCTPYLLHSGRLASRSQSTATNGTMPCSSKGCKKAQARRSMAARPTPRAQNHVAHTQPGPRHNAPAASQPQWCKQGPGSCSGHTMAQRTPAAAEYGQVGRDRWQRKAPWGGSGSGGGASRGSGAAGRHRDPNLAALACNPRRPPACREAHTRTTTVGTCACSTLSNDRWVSWITAPFCS